MPIIGVVASSDKSVPNAPTIGTATNVGTGRAYNNGRADVTFTAPTYTGRLPITSYTVTSSPGGFTGTGAASPISVTGLQSGVAYTFTVTATNGVGTSGASAASNSITATTVPQAPTIGTATAGDASATVAFTAGATGGSAITTFTATSSPGSLTGTSATSPITVSGLTNGTAYTFTVTATNANGTSLASAASNSVTPAAAASYESLATIVPNGVSSFTFSSIPQTYSHLELRLRTTDLADSGSGVFVRPNNNTNFVYGVAGYAAEGSSATVTSRNLIDDRIALYRGGLGTTIPTVAIIKFFNYSSTSVNKNAMVEMGYLNGASNNYLLSSHTTLVNTAAISSITVTSNTAGTFSTNSVFALYGIKG